MLFKTFLTPGFGIWTGPPIYSNQKNHTTTKNSSNFIKHIYLFLQTFIWEKYNILQQTSNLYHSLYFLCEF